MSKDQFLLKGKSLIHAGQKCPVPSKYGVIHPIPFMFYAGMQVAFNF